LLTLPSFEMARPRSLEEALGALAEDGARVLAGGTDLVPNMKRGLVAPRRLVSVRHVRELAGVRIDEDGALILGAATTLADVAADARVREGWPAIARAADMAASPPIRNVATVGGNVCLDTRCSFYDQSAFWRGALGHCTKTCGQTCHVVEGGRRCVAAFAADTPVALVAYGARVRVASCRGARVMPLEELYVADGARHTVLAPGELVTAVEVPPPPARTRAAYSKVRVRGAIDFPALAMAARVSFAADVAVDGVALVVGAVGPRPRAVGGLDDLARGRPLDARVIDAVAERAREACRPFTTGAVDAAHLRAVLPVHVRRLLEDLRREVKS
jgi:4-hydroxybenzoyl-CoA reductase subunit beta